jgi:hypothetical protein
MEFQSSDWSGELNDVQLLNRFSFSRSASLSINLNTHASAAAARQLMFADSAQGFVLGNFGRELSRAEVV